MAHAPEPRKKPRAAGLTGPAARAMYAAAMAGNARGTPPTRTPAGKARAEDQFRRRAEALRHNLKRRKHQQRDRKDPGPERPKTSEE